MSRFNSVSNKYTPPRFIVHLGKMFKLSEQISILYWYDGSLNMKYKTKTNEVDDVENGHIS